MIKLIRPYQVEEFTDTDKAINFWFEKLYQGHKAHIKTQDGKKIVKWKDKRWNYKKQ